MTLKVHHLRPAPGAKTAKTRVGRGEGGTRGKTAGRGTKGTKARYQVPGGFEGGQMPLHMRLPKLKGFNNPFRVEYQAINLDTLQECGLDDVTPEALHSKDDKMVVPPLVGALLKNEQDLTLFEKLVFMQRNNR